MFRVAFPNICTIFGQVRSTKTRGSGRWVDGWTGTPKAEQQDLRASNKGVLFTTADGDSIPGLRRQWASHQFLDFDRPIALNKYPIVSAAVQNTAATMRREMILRDCPAAMRW